MPESSLYPLSFKPIYKDKIWGGNKIKGILNKDVGDLPNCGESWEISGVEGNISVVEQGNLKGKRLDEIITDFDAELLGERVFSEFGEEFPLLIKFLDANDDLSIQVHPNDELALKRHNSKGKTEMWYIFQADEGSKLISGFNQKVDSKIFKEKVNSGKLMDILNQESAKADDVFFLPAGRVHTIGKGLLLAEIQQTSDVTYRIYDFERVDSQGKKRELHIEDAIEAIDYSHQDSYKTEYDRLKNEVVNLVKCQHFTTNKLHFNKAVVRDYTNIDSFVIYICMEGAGQISADGITYSIGAGRCMLIPAAYKNMHLKPTPEFKMLECYIEL
ncbi:MAG: mannose-6-phosphate isomerase [Cyclobacteriaceae bacterium]